VAAAVELAAVLDDEEARAEMMPLLRHGQVMAVVVVFCVGSWILWIDLE